MFKVSAFSHFDAAHFLKDYPGKCANIHGHRWKVEITIQGVRLNELGILVDFMDVKTMLKEVLEMFDHKLVNDIPPFDELNPTAENLSRFIFTEMQTKLAIQTGGEHQITKVTVWESEAASATYFE